MDNPEAYGGTQFNQTESAIAAAAKLNAEASQPAAVVPKSILIIGAGVFGISTALELLSSERYNQTSITIVDAYAPEPDSKPRNTNDDASASLNTIADGQDSSTYKKEVTASLDTSRIIRPDYTRPLYANLADKAAGLFRNGWAEGSADVAERTYTQPGLVLVSTGATDGRGHGYLKAAYENTLHLARLAAGNNSGVEPVSLPMSADIEALLGSPSGSLPESTAGYINPQAGWANASAAIAAVKNRVVELGRARDAEGKAPFRFLSGTKVKSLLFSDDKDRVMGALLESSEAVHADIIVLAAGAWTTSFLPSLLSPRLRASGQVLAYIPLESAEEVAHYAGKPTIMDMESGMFAIYPPKHYMSESRSRAHFKVARHGWGYAYSRTIQDPLTSANIECFLPADNEADFFSLPREAKQTCRAFAQTIAPEIASRAFSLERVCWYCDTPTSDFLIDFIPGLQGVLVATGGSGHGFKFLPVLGEQIVARLEGRLDVGLHELWRWRSEEECARDWLGEGDASRGGPRGMEWKIEVAK